MLKFGSTANVYPNVCHLLMCNRHEEEAARAAALPLPDDDDDIIE